MPPRSSSTTRRKKPAVSKEELARLQKEEEERQRLETLLVLEKEAEDFQSRENAERDEAEYKEKKRLKKESQMKILQEKDSMIQELSSQLQNLQISFSSERESLEHDIVAKQALCDRLGNDLSVQRSEADETHRRLIASRDDLQVRIEVLERQLHDEEEASKALQAESQREITLAHEHISKLQSELESIKSEVDLNQREWDQRRVDLESTVEKLTTLNATLQAAVEAHAIDDQKNVALLQLLNNQLDEHKRSSQLALDEEKQHAKESQQELAVMKTKLSHADEKNELLESENTQLRADTEKEVQDLRSTIDSLKFEAKFMVGQLQALKAQHAEETQAADAARDRIATEVSDLKQSNDALHVKTEELETTLRKKERDNFDKVTFLNAQLANNRTIIAQLQQKLTKEREERASEGAATADELEKRNCLNQSVTKQLEQRSSAAAEVESKLHSDISILKTTVFQLQAALVDRERENETCLQNKEAELERLREKMADHFVIRDAPGSSKQLIAVSDTAKDQLEATVKVALENEARLKAQVLNQNQIIDTLQIELHKERDKSESATVDVKSELYRLRQLLQLHSIQH